MTSAARTLANRENATKSTGPVTPEGKQASSMNATRHGLTAQHMVLQPHEETEFNRLHNAYTNDLRPKTELERDLVLKIVDCSVRLSRISAIENNIFHLATLEHIRTEDAQDPLMEFAIAQSRAYLERANEIDKLSRYQSRISRQMLQYTKELSRLQKERRAWAEQKEDKKSASFRQSVPASGDRTENPMGSFGKPPVSRYAGQPNSQNRIEAETKIAA
jgi:hypothetical protein